MCLACSGMDMEVFRSDERRPPQTLILVNGETGEGGELFRLCAEAMDRPWALAVLSCGDWNRDLSPWPAPAVFRGGGDFAGGGKAWLRQIEGEALPALRAELGCPDAPCWLAGYSLAGLFALWALYESDAFAGAVSASGSLWYPGFAEEALRRPLRGKPAVYLSLGDAEARTRNPVMRTVQDCTERLSRRYGELGLETVFELNPGNHFQEPAERLAKGVRWALRRGETV